MSSRRIVSPVRADATGSSTVEEYLEIDAPADDERYERQNGSVTPTAGVEPEHNQRKDNGSSERWVRLWPEGCWVIAYDQQVRLAVRAVIRMSSSPVNRPTRRRAGDPTERR